MVRNKNVILNPYLDARWNVVVQWYIVHCTLYIVQWYISEQAALSPLQFRLFSIESALFGVPPEIVGNLAKLMQSDISSIPLALISLDC